MTPITSTSPVIFRWFAIQIAISALLRLGVIFSGFLEASKQVPHAVPSPLAPAAEKVHFGFTQRIACRKYDEGEKLSGALSRLIFCEFFLPADVHHFFDDGLQVGKQLGGGWSHHFIFVHVLYLYIICS